MVPTVDTGLGRSSSVSISTNCSSSIFFLRSSSLSSSYTKSSTLIAKILTGTHDVELVFTFFINNVFIYLLESPRKCAPPFRCGVMPHQHGPLACRRCNHWFTWVPLQGENFSQVNQYGRRTLTSTWTRGSRPPSSAAANWPLCWISHMYIL